MRKMYLLFSLALLLVGVNIASAKLVLGDQKTTFADGDKVFFQGCSNINNGDAWVVGSYMRVALKDDPTATIYLYHQSGNLPAVGSNFLFELRAADKEESIVLDGVTYPGWHLYCPALGKYASRSGNYSIMKKNPARAGVYYLVPPRVFAKKTGDADWSETYAKLEGALSTAFCVMVRDKSSGEGNGGDGYDYKALNRAYSTGEVAATYTDWAGWWYVFDGDDVDDPSGDLTVLVDKLAPIVAGGVVGTLPGNVVNAESFEALKTAYAAATAADADAATVYPVLKEAYDKFCEYGYNGFVTLEDGYYRIVSADPRFVEKDGNKRAMYGRVNDLRWRTLDENAKDQIWQVKATEDPTRFAFRNVSSLGYIHAKDDAVHTTTDSVACYIRQSKHYIPNIFVMGNNKTLHAGSHGSGSGTDGAMTSYQCENDEKGEPSTWGFEKVENFTADELQGNIDQIIRNAEYADLLATAMSTYRIAVGFSPYDKDENSLITYAPAEGEDPSAKEYGDLGTWTGGTIKCNYKQSSEGSYGALCDGLVQDKSFFHSQWSGSTADWHYLQFDLEQPIQNVAFFWNRRVNEGTPRRLSEIDVQVCPDTVGGGVWTTVATLNADYVITGDEVTIDGKLVIGNDEVVTGAAPLFGSYKHIRMVAKGVMSRTINQDTGLPEYTLNSGKSGSYPYFTVSELHILGVEVDPDCQMSALKNNEEIAPLVTALENEFTHAITVVEPTADDLANLQKAYDEFVAVFPDPTPLTKLIEDTQKYMANMYVGGVPGTYETQNALDEKLLAVNNVIELAQADIDDQTLYTKQQVEDHIAAIEAAKQELIDGARPIDFTKWVRMYITREYWAKNPDLALPSDWVLNSAMYAPETAESEIGEIPFDLFDPSIAQSFDWRFIPVTGGYIIQSRSTGKFIGESRSYESSHSWYPALSSVPAVFTVEPIGGGSFVIAGANLNGSGVTEKAGFSEPYKYLHGAVAGQALAYWETKELGSRSGWEFEIQNDEAFTDDANADMENAFTAKNLVANKLYTGCYPTSVTLIPEEGQLNVYTVAGKDADESVIYLRKMEDVDGGYTIPAGTPFLYEMGAEGSDFTQYVETEGEEASYVVDIYYEVYPTLNAEENDALFVTAPEKTAGVVGLFSDERVYKGHGLVSVYEKSNAVVPYFLNEIEEDDEITRTVLHRAEAYIDPASATVLSADEAADCKELPIAGKVDNAIDQIAGADTEGTFDVYTIDGIRVRTGVNKANALKGLKSGLYIINKQKVVVE